MMDHNSSSFQQLTHNDLHESSEDRLSSLPENVIDAILTRLPLKDAVRTSILSPSWRYKWSTLSHIQFNCYDFPRSKNQPQKKYDRKHVKIIDQVLLLHRGPIRKFKLSIDLETSMDVDRWILFVSRNGITEFILDKWKCKDQSYKIPSCLFSCEEVKYLELYNCTLSPPNSFRGYNNLTALDLRDVSCSNDVLENLISYCPLLNKLVLRNIYGCYRLKLSAPNLVDLEVEGDIEDICFEKTLVLAKASLELSNHEESVNTADGVKCKLFNLRGCLPGLRRLELLGDTCQILLPTGGDVPVWLPTTPQLVHLSLTINFEDIQQMLTALCIFRSSSFLQKIDIKSISDNKSEEISFEDFWESQQDFNCLFSQLQIINVTEFTGTACELKFIEFVLASAAALEMVKIELKKSTSDVLKIFRKLIRFQRVSSKAQIIIPE